MLTNIDWNVVAAFAPFVLIPLAQAALFCGPEKIRLLWITPELDRLDRETKRYRSPQYVADVDRDIDAMLLRERQERHRQAASELQMMSNHHLTWTQAPA